MTQVDLSPPKNSTNVRAPFFHRGARWALGGAQRWIPGLAERCAEELFCTPPRPRASRGVAARLSTGDSFAVPFGGRCLAAWAWGRGPVVLLVHGWGSRGGHLGAFVPALLADGFRVVAYDAPAHGDSPGRQTTLPEMVAALQAVATEVGPLHGLIGHSIGGAAVALAARQGLQAGRVVLISAPGENQVYTARFAERLGLNARSVRGLRRRVARRAGIRWSDFDLHRFGAELKVPALVIHDEADDEVPWDQGQMIARSWPDARLHTTRGLGHRRVLKDPQVIERAVHFLGGRTNPEGAHEMTNPMDDRAATASCPSCGEAAGDWDPRQTYCDACALERTLFMPDSRWAPQEPPPVPGV